MIKINNINFTQKTIESIQIDGDDIKEINFEFHEREFKLRIIKDNQEIIEEAIEEKPKNNFVEEVIEEEPNEVVEDEENKEVIEEVQQEINEETNYISIGEVKKLIYDNIPKKNTADTFLEHWSRFMTILNRMTF